VPKTEKPGSCSRATRHLEGEVAVETKYDGERYVPSSLALVVRSELMPTLCSLAGSRSTST